MASRTADQPILGEKYRLIRLLDAGGMGAVWLAEHIHLRSLVAIKVIGREVAATAAGAQRFLLEARTAASLRSPHVVQILDYGVQDGTAFIAMELLEGESLAARLHRERRLASPEATAIILRQVARAVGRAHDRGIIHRDLKPANIFLVRNEEEVLVKLLDFGIAKTTALSAAASATSYTLTGEFLGSPSYASPEQLEGSKMLDHRTDIWSFGMIAFECLVGRSPFAGKTVAGVVLGVCSRPLPIPSKLGVVPTGFDAWFARACARNVERRYQSVREASNDLQQVIEAWSGRTLPASHSQSSPELLGLPALPDAVAIHERSQLDADLAPDSAPWTPTFRLTRRALGTRTSSSGTVLAQRPNRPRSWALLLLMIIALIPIGTFAFRTVPHETFTLAVLALTERIGKPALAMLPTPHADQGPLSQMPPQGEAPPAEAPAATAPTVDTGIAITGEGDDLRLSIDGKEVGLLPQPQIALAPGEHRVEVSSGPRYGVFRERVDVEAGHVTDLGPVRLEVLHGIAKIQSADNAEGAELALRVDGFERPLDPVSGPLEVDTAHPAVVVARRTGFAPLELPLVFEPGHAERTFEIQLTELPAGSAPEATAESRSAPARRKRHREAGSGGSADGLTSFLFITSTAPADVLLDGTPLGKTPLPEMAVEPGLHNITFLHEGARNAETVDLRSGEHKRVSARIQTPGDGLDAETVQRIVHRESPGVRDRCWQQALWSRSLDDQTSARVTATLTVDPGGRVRSVSSSPGPENYPDLVRCIEDEVRGWQFPQAAAETVVNVPFLFIAQ